MASFTFMELHTLLQLQIWLLCSSAPLSELFFLATWFSGGLFVCLFFGVVGGVGWGGGRRSRCILQERTLEIVGKITPYTATLLLHLKSTQRAQLGQFSYTLLQREATFLTPSSSVVCV